MPGIQIRYHGEPITASVSAAVVGGEPVDADQTNSVTDGALVVKPSASEGSLLCVGVALIDAAPAGTDPASYADPRPPQTVVAHVGVVPVTFSGASTFGDRLKTDGNGGVLPWVDGTDDPGKVVGINWTEGGSVASGSVGLMRITLT